MFRDESERIIRKVHTLHEVSESQEKLDAIFDPPNSSKFSISKFYSSIPNEPSQPVNEIGANFFFTNYTCLQPPLSESYHEWLTRMYLEDTPNHGLRAAIEAAGMAGISNRFYAPNVDSKSKEQYIRALTATKKALSDPVISVADTTLVTVIALGVFEVCPIPNKSNIFVYASQGSLLSLLLLRIVIIIAHGLLISKVQLLYCSLEVKMYLTRNEMGNSLVNYALNW
jgi:hypothetical protein